MTNSNLYTLWLAANFFKNDNDRPALTPLIMTFLEQHLFSNQRQYCENYFGGSHHGRCTLPVDVPATSHNPLYVSHQSTGVKTFTVHNHMLLPTVFESLEADYWHLAVERGRLINDPVGICLTENHWWFSISESDVALWAEGLARGAGLDVRIEEADVWPLAVQVPLAEQLMARVLDDIVKDINFFRNARLIYRNHTFIVTRSGWSKQVART